MVCWYLLKQAMNMWVFNTLFFHGLFMFCSLVLNQKLQGLKRGLEWNVGRVWLLLGVGVLLSAGRSH